MRFIFPFKEIKVESNIVLYGASECGYDFYRQVTSTGYCNIVLWIDRQYKWWRTMKLPVDEPEKIEGQSFDYVVLTAEVKNVADSMKNYLMSLGVQEDKIIWKEDYLIKNNVAASYDKKRIKIEAKDAFLDNPNLYVKEDMLDVVIRYLYAKDIILGMDDSRHKEMYQKLMMLHNDACEPTEDMINSYFTEYKIKKGEEAFDYSLKELISSVKERGFNKENFIPLDSKNRLINGRHRLAVAIALNIKAWFRNYPYDGIKQCVDKQWLIDNNFTNKEIEEIEKNFLEISNA